jgi:hypothetical protein
VETGSPAAHVCSSFTSDHLSPPEGSHEVQIRLVERNPARACEPCANVGSARVCPRWTRVCHFDKANRRFAGLFAKPSSGLEPETPSLPWRFGSVTRVRARSSATQFFLQVSLIWAAWVCRETSRVSFLMCPFCVRGGLLVLATVGFRPLKADPCVRASPALVLSTTRGRPGSD